MKLINTFATELPWACESVAPQPLQQPRLLHLNRALLDELGLGGVSEPDWIVCCGEGKLLPGMQPVAQIYAGHQFGGYSPQLGMVGRCCWGSSWRRMASAGICI